MEIKHFLARAIELFSVRNDLYKAVSRFGQTEITEDKITEFLRANYRMAQLETNTNPRELDLLQKAQELKNPTGKKAAIEWFQYQYSEYLDASSQIPNPSRAMIEEKDRLLKGYSEVIGRLSGHQIKSRT